MQELRPHESWTERVCALEHLKSIESSGYKMGRIPRAVLFWSGEKLTVNSRQPAEGLRGSQTQYWQPPLRMQIPVPEMQIRFLEEGSGHREHL